MPLTTKRGARLAASILRLIVWAALSLSPLPAMAEVTTLRVGHFPNITHVQALVAHHFSRKGKGWFEAAARPGVKIEWFVYNAGPSAMEAMFAKSIDLTYVGPNPALNAYVKSRGDEVRIVAGAAEGGSALVVQKDSALATAADFRGKKIATPQLGNTQDVAARAWLTAGGLRITLTGGDAQVMPTANPDQLLLFKQKQVDAVWTVEPWVSRLEMEADGRVLVEDSARHHHGAGGARGCARRAARTRAASSSPRTWNSPTGSRTIRRKRNGSRGKSCWPKRAPKCRKSSLRAPGSGSC